MSKGVRKTLIFPDGKAGLFGIILKIIAAILVLSVLFFIALEFYFGKEHRAALSGIRNIEIQNTYVARKIRSLQPNYRNFLVDNLSDNYGKLSYSPNIKANRVNNGAIDKLSVGELVKFSTLILEYLDLIAKDGLTSKSVWNNYPLCFPIDPNEKYVITRPFSESIPDPFTGEDKRHNGIDIAPLNSGTAILLPADGEVTAVRSDVFWGKMIRVRHAGNYETFYAHMGDVSVKPGQKLKRGARIGTFGESGWTTHPHLHYELIKNGVHVDPQLYNFNYLYD